MATYDTVIRNGQVADGTGAKLRLASKRMTRAVLALPWPLAMATWAAKRPPGRATGQAAMRYRPSVRDAGGSAPIECSYGVVA
mgnify:CR=1 FL=1